MDNTDIEYINHAINEGFTDGFADYNLQVYKDLFDESERSKGRFIEYLTNKFEGNA